MKSHLLIVGLRAIGVLSRTLYFAISLLWDLVYLFFCWGRWSIWTWVLCRVIKMDLFSFFYTQTSSWASTIYWRCFFLLCAFGSFTKKSSIHHSWVYFWAIDSIPSINVSLLFLALLSCSTAWDEDGDSSWSSFIVQDCFGYPGFIILPYEGENCSVRVCKKLLEFWWGLHWICRLILVRCPFSLLILPIPEHGRSFCLLRSSSVSS